MAEEAKPKAEEAGKNAMDSLGKAYEAAKPVVNDVVSGTIDFIKEVEKDTRPELKTAAL